MNIVTTIGPLDVNHRAPVIAALRHNFSLGGIRQVTLLSEVDVGWLEDLRAGSRLLVQRVASRPSFKHLIAEANNQLRLGAKSVAITNADVSLRSERDVEKIKGLLNFLSTPEVGPPVIALTRHETSKGEPRLKLYESGTGLSNSLSADFWAFAQPLELAADMFYSPGQMNCDMMFSYDLVASGYRVFNPCLDIVLSHHSGEVSEEWYKEKNAEPLAKELIARHRSENNIEPWNYYGIPWVKSDWLKSGYQPQRHTTNGRRLILALAPDTEHRLESLLPQLRKLVDAYRFEVQIITESDPSAIIQRHAAIWPTTPWLWFSQPSVGVKAVFKGLLMGEQYMSDRLAFVSDLSRIDNKLVQAADLIYVQVKCDSRKMIDMECTCTLITSVYKSDQFLFGFLANCRALVGYDKLIEHVFLVSDLSSLEASLLEKVLLTEKNSVVIWHRKDPGLYECWNIGIRVSRSEYVSNANVDDLRDPAHVATLVRDLEEHPECQLAASALNPFEKYPAAGELPYERAAWYTDRAGYFGFFDIASLSNAHPPALVPFNMPHCMPVWRRSVHQRFGWFDEERYGTFADWAFWLKVLHSGETGWLESQPLGFYYVNPASHNCRGSKLDFYHSQVEADFREFFVAREEKRVPNVARLSADVYARKLILRTKNEYFGQHRNSFNLLIHALEPLEVQLPVEANGGAEGVLFIPFLERQFVWGGELGEAASNDPKPLDQPWIGILHVPFSGPEWWNDKMFPERFMQSELFQQSRPFCLGLITLAKDIENDLKAYDPDMPSLSVLHPTNMNSRLFNIERYKENPRIVQVGDWLRKLQAIHQLKVKSHQRIMLLKKHTMNYLQREIALFGDFRDSAVDMRNFVTNEEYDDLLSSSVVLSLLYGTAANNVVIECIARATPILINPLPATVEYLGRDYPLYATSVPEADALLGNFGAIEAAHEYLIDHRAKIDLSYQGFCRTVGSSVLYESI